MSDARQAPATSPPPPSTSAANLEGRSLGEFVIGKRLGEGGFGLVYLAEQPALGREAVIKVLRDTSLDVTVVSRFTREAQLASRLDHPYAAHVYSFGVEPDGLLWIAMERVRGRPLSELLRSQGPMPLRELVPFLEALCEVVHAAHEAGIVHRDIKPSNVMVISPAGRRLPKLLDFGIAKLQGTPEEEAPHPIEHTLSETMGSTVLRTGFTDADSVLGSPLYMAPEQWSASSTVDGRADIYSLGILAYEALTGMLPFKANSVTAMAGLHARAKMPPLPDTLPAEAGQVLERALAKRPEDRFQTAVDFAAALRSAALLDTDEAPLPYLDAKLSVTLSSEAPRPIAEALLALEAAHSSTSAWSAVHRLWTAVLRYLGLVALAAAARQGGASLSEEARTAMSGLMSEELSLGRWLGLVTELVRPYAMRPELHPVPELVRFAADRGPRLAPLLERLDAGHPAKSTEATLRSELSELFHATGPLLRGLTFLTEYSLVLYRGGRLERWMGSRRAQLPSVQVATPPVPEGHLALTDSAGNVLFSLHPLVQVNRPAPGTPEEVFLLQGHGRFGARLVATPSDFELQDPELPAWISQRFSGLDTGSSKLAGDETAPYRGLASFTASDSGHFFGREREAEAFANRLRMQPFLAVVGASGAGKSSFVQAGVVPLLPPRWATVVVRPGGTPLATLTRALEGLDVELGPISADADVGTCARRLLDGVTRSGATLLLVVDQFEELITLCAEQAERETYVRLLSELTRSPQLPVRIIVTLRDDFLMRVQRLPTMREKLAEGLQLLNTPPREDLLRIVAEPARRLGFEFEDPKLPEEMVDAVSEQPGALALLSFTASKLWDARDRHFHQLTRKAYALLGGVGGALAQHAEATLTSLPEEAQRMVREAFRHLITAEGTRWVVTRAELRELLGNSPAADTMLERLINARLLVASEGATEGQERLEVIHEALISAWPRLVKWRAENAENARLRDQLRAGARQWDQRGRPRGLLWRDEALQEYSVWRRRNPGPLTSVEEAFTRASLAEEAKGRRIRQLLLATSFVVLVAGLVVLFRANGRAERAAQQAKQRLAALHVEQGRIALVDGRPLQALAYLDQAFGEGVRGTGIDYMLGRARRLASGQLASLAVPGKRITSFALHPANAQVATGLDDGAVVLWDTLSWRQVRTLERGSSGILRALVFHPDGRWLAGVSSGSVSIWDPNGPLLATIDCNGRGASVAVSPDGSSLIEISDNGQLVRLWNVAEPNNPKLRHSWAYPSGGAAVFRPDGRAVLLFRGPHSNFERDSESPVEWNLATNRPMGSYVGHTGSVRSAEYQGDRLLTASDDGTARVWDVGSHRQLLKLEGHLAGVRRATYSPDGSAIVTGSNDQTARLWDARTGRLVAILAGHLGPVTQARYSQDGRRIMTASDDGTTRLYDAESQHLLWAYYGHTQPILSSTLDERRQWIVTVSRDGSLKVFLTDRRLTSQDLRVGSEAGWFVLNGDGTRLLAGIGGGHLEEWNLLTGERIRTLNVALTAPAYFDWSTDGKWLAANDGSRVVVFSYPSLERAAMIEGHPAGVEIVALSPEGSRLLTTSQDQTAALWEPGTGKRVARLEGHDSAVLWGAFDRTGARVVTGTANGELAVWDARDGKQLKKWKGHASAVYPTDWSADGRYLVTGGFDQIARVWSATTYEPVATLTGHTAPIEGVSFNPSTSLLSTASLDGTLKTWDTSSWKEIDSFASGEECILSRFHPNGEHVLTLSLKGGRLQTWPVSFNKDPPEVVSRAVRCGNPYRLEREQLVTVVPGGEGCSSEQGQPPR